MMVGLFISTAFISPAMATIASQIPYLNQIFHSDSILDSVSQIIDEEGIQVSSSGVRYLPKRKYISFWMDLKIITMILKGS